MAKSKRKKIPNYVGEFKAVQAELDSGRYKSFKEFERAMLKKVRRVTGSPGFDKMDKELRDRAKGYFAKMEEKAKGAAEEPAQPAKGKEDPAKKAKGKEETTQPEVAAEDLAQPAANVEDPNNPTKAEGPETVQQQSPEATRTTTKKKPTEKKPTKAESQEKKAAEPQKKKAVEPQEKKAEEQKPSKYEVRAQKAEAALKKAQVDYLRIEREVHNSEENQANYKKQLEEKSKDGKVSAVALAKEAKKYEKLLDQLQAQIDKIGKLSEVSVRASALRDSMDELKKVYSDISRKNETSRENNQQQRDALKERGESEKSNDRQKRRLSLSQRKMGRMMFFGAVAKNLAVVPAKKLSFVLRRMGKDDLAKKLEAKVAGRVDKVNESVDGKVKDEFDKRTKIEDRVDIVSQAAKDALMEKRDHFISKGSDLSKWRDQKRNKATPFIGKLSELAAKKEEAAQLRALTKYSKAIGRTQRRMERRIVHGRDKTETEDLREEFTDKTQKTNDRYDRKSEKGSKVFRFVDRGNKIRGILDNARETADKKRQRAMDGMEVKVARAKEREDQEEDKSLGTKFKYKLAQRGRDRRLTDMRLGYEDIGSTRRGAANIAAFLGLRGAAIKMNASGVRAQKKFVDKRLERVMDGSKLEQIALNVGKASIDVPIIAGAAVAGLAVETGRAVAGATVKAVDDARTFVENVREENAKAYLDSLDGKRRAIYAQVEGVLSPEDRQRAQEELAKEDAQREAEGEEIGG